MKRLICWIIGHDWWLYRDGPKRNGFACARCGLKEETWEL